MRATKHDELVATKAWDSAVMRRLTRYARPHAGLFVKSFLILLALFGTQLYGPWLIRGAVDGPIASAQAALQVDPGADVSPWVQTLGWWALGYLLVVAVSSGLRYFEVAWLTRTGQAVIHDLRTALFRHIQRLQLSWFDKHPTGSLVTRVTSDIENLNELFTSGLVVLIFDLLKVVIVLGLLFSVSVPLATLVLVLTPLLIGVSLVFRGGARRAHRTVRARLARLNGFLQEILSGIRVVQMFRREKLVSGRFTDHLSGYLSANLRTIFLFALFYPIVGFVVFGIQGSIVWSGGASIAAGSLTFGEFLFFWFLLQHLVGPIRELGERYNILQSAFASAERIFDILDTEPVIASPTRALALPRPFTGHVVFEHVSFSYGGAGGTPVIEDVSFEIPPGATVAMVGATGAGKSTLVNLLLRFYDPTAGRITIDGVDLRELDLATYRHELGIVLQEDFLFSGTVRQNLELGRDRVDDDTIETALATSSADELVRRLANGLDTEVEERGATLSTGERELISIARALAGEPGLVILDEATSSVDSGTEARIEAATHSLLRERSALVVAHRLSTVRRADRILVLHKGRLREAGTHNELLAEGGIYARLHAMQFSADDRSAEAV